MFVAVVVYPGKDIFTLKVTTIDVRSLVKLTVTTAVSHVVQ
jgi:hypothetical protein